METLTIPKEIRNRITIKNVKTNIGHDLAGFYFDMYLDGKKIGYIQDDGYGGELDVEISDSDQKTIVSLCDKYITRKSVHTGYVEFGMESDGLTITDSDMLNDLVYKLVGEWEQEKEDKKNEEKRKRKIAKLQLNGFVYGNDEKLYYSSYKYTLEFIAKNKLEVLQKGYDDLKAKLSSDQKIYNTNLTKLGIKL